MTHTQGDRASTSAHDMWRAAEGDLKTALRALVAAESEIIVSGNRMESVCIFLYDRGFPIDTNADVLRAMLSLMDPEGVVEWSTEADPNCRKWMDVYNLYNRIRSRAKFHEGDQWLRTFGDLGLRPWYAQAGQQIRCSICEDLYPVGGECSCG